jgi:hypothetical protein
VALTSLQGSCARPWGWRGRTPAPLAAQCACPCPCRSGIGSRCRLPPLPAVEHSLGRSTQPPATDRSSRTACYQQVYSACAWSTYRPLAIAKPAEPTTSMSDTFSPEYWHCRHAHNSIGYLPYTGVRIALYKHAIQQAHHLPPASARTACWGGCWGGGSGPHNSCGAGNTRASTFCCSRAFT